MLPYGPQQPADSRYSRQILFPGVGRSGQELLSRARVAIVGVGATGAASATLLARAGVGHLTLIDRDIVETSNLQRQILFDEEDAASSAPKAKAAQSKIALFNSGISVEAKVTDLVPANVSSLLHQSQLILDCTDNFETRYLINDYAVQQSKPWIYAAAVGASCATMNVVPGSSACLACLFPVPPAGLLETCDTDGILGSAVNLAASLQVAEALKLLTNQSNLLRRTLFSYDVWFNQRFEISASTPDPDCSVCGQREFTHLAGSTRPHITLCGRNSVQIHEHRRPVSLGILHRRLQLDLEVSSLFLNGMLLRFAYGRHAVTVFADGRALIHGTTDVGIARSLYARFIGS